MSSKPSAKMIEADDISLLQIEFDPEDMTDVNAVMVGDVIKGTIYLTTHECPFCHSQMQTLGVAHGSYDCSKCAATRSRSITMTRRYECLENE
jgi:transposase-like protein